MLLTEKAEGVICPQGMLLFLIARPYQEKNKKQPWRPSFTL